MEISFGTDGWRGIISDQITFSNLRRLAAALAAYLHREGYAGNGVVVGYDTRFLSREYAAEVAEVLAGQGVKVYLAEEAAPSPVISFCVKQLRAAAGMVITASHNPPIYNGVKIKGPHGGPALPELLAGIICCLSEERPAPESTIAEIHPFHPAASYLPRTLTLVDSDRLAHSNLRIVVDSMYGSGQGYLSSLLRRCGLPCLEIHQGFNPGFDGLTPEPVFRNLGPLTEAVARYQADLGIALDGDGDRLGVIDREGKIIDSHYLIALLVRHLAENRHWPGDLAKTVATTLMMDRLAQRYGRRLHTTPVGFQHLSRLFLERELLLAGEDSGGFGVRNHLPERDGIAAGLLLVELLASSPLPLREQAAEINRLAGPLYYRRLDFKLSPELIDRYRQWLRSPPERLGRFRVTGVEELDGVKLWLGKHGWVLVRLSGTEPLLRLYAESDSLRKTQEILRSARKLFDR